MEPSKVFPKWLKVLKEKRGVEWERGNHEKKVINVKCDKLNSINEEVNELKTKNKRDKWTIVYRTSNL